MGKSTRVYKNMEMVCLLIDYCRFLEIIPPEDKNLMWGSRYSTQWTDMQATFADFFRGKKDIKAKAAAKIAANNWQWILDSSFSPIRPRFFEKWHYRRNARHKKKKR